MIDWLNQICRLLIDDQHTHTFTHTLTPTRALEKAKGRLAMPGCTVHNTHTHTNSQTRMCVRTNTHIHTYTHTHIHTGGCSWQHRCREGAHSHKTTHNTQHTQNTHKTHTKHTIHTQFTHTHTFPFFHLLFSYPLFISPYRAPSSMPCWVRGMSSRPTVHHPIPFHDFLMS